MIQPHEISFIDMLVKETGQLGRFVPADTIARGILDVENPIRLFEKLQEFVENAVKSDADLQELAIQGYQTYVAGYSVKDQSVKACFNKAQLHLGHIAKSFGLSEAPSKLAALTKWSRDEHERRREWQKSSERSRKD